MLPQTLSWISSRQLPPERSLYLKRKCRVLPPKKFHSANHFPSTLLQAEDSPHHLCDRSPSPRDLCLSGGTAAKTAFSPSKTATVGGKLYNLQTPLRNCESLREKVSSLFCELGKIYTEPLKLQIFGGGAVKMTHWVARINRPCFL